MKTIKLVLLSIILFCLLQVTNSIAQTYNSISSAKQRNLSSFSTIVIDAGHGGYDNGTNGRRYKEKDIALDIALKVGKLVENKMPEVKVVYTRKTDTFVPLKERAKIANQNQADLFISIHCNGGSQTASGTETFVLGLHRNEDNLKVAMRENNSILLEDNFHSHYGMIDPASPEAYILFNLFQNAHLNQSLELASTIENTFGSFGRKSRGVKQAGFLVLRETTMPSVLVETGFLTNSSEENFLASTKGKNEIATSIYQAIERYKEAVEKEYNRIRFAEMERNAISREEHLLREESKWAWPSFRSVLDDSKEQFYVQLLVSKEPTKGKETFPFTNITINPIEIIHSFKYVMGPYSSKDEAKVDQRKAQDAGFRDAYILQYRNGKIVR